MTVGRNTLGALLQTFFALVSRFGGMIALLTLVLTVADTALERSVGSSFQLIGNIASMIASFFFLAHMLRSEGLIEREGGFGSYFGASLLSGLGVIAGLILLILPGFFLAARWAIATSLAITRNLSANEALGESWALTKPSTGVLMLLYIVLLALLIGIVFGVGVGASAMAGGDDTLGSAALVNSVVDLGVMLGVVLNVAIYIEVVGRGTEVEAVFA
jgi:hypothetical protein